MAGSVTALPAIFVNCTARNPLRTAQIRAVSGRAQRLGARIPA
jgi:hypothetical protein